MKKSLIPTLVLVFGMALWSFATNYTWVKQGTKNQKIGFGSVISADSLGSVAISDCNGMAAVTGNSSCQIGTGTVEADSLGRASYGDGDYMFQVRDNLLIEDDGRLGVRMYGSMRLFYAMWKEEFNEAGYIANAATTNSLGQPVGQSRFSEVAYGGGYLVTVVDGGGDNAEVIQIDDSVDSLLSIISNNASNDTVQVQLNGEPFKLTSGKEMWFQTRFAVTDVSAANFAIGLTLRASTDTIGTAPADGVYFQMDHDGNLDYHVIQNSTDTTADTGVDLTDASLHSAGFYYDGVSTLTISVDGTVITNLVDDGVTIVFPDDEELTAFVAVEAYNVNTVQGCQVDHIGVINSR